MKKFLLALFIVGIIIVLYITIFPQINSFFISQDLLSADAYAEKIVIESAAYFTVLQGESEAALYVENQLNEAVNFSLGHEHSHLMFRPQGGRLAPGSTQEVILHVDPQCPVGEIELPVYLRFEIGERRITNDTIISLDVLPGVLSMKQDQYGLNVLFNREQAPRGAVVYYRELDGNEWELWGVNPNINPPSHLEPGSHEFEFIAELGEIESEIELFEIIIPEIVVEEEPEPRPKRQQAAPPVQKEVEPEPARIEPPKPGTREYAVYLQHRLPGESPEEFVERVMELRKEAESSEKGIDHFFNMPGEPKSDFN